MTIGIGFLCDGGITICADRQLTGEGGFKFEEGKIWCCCPDGWTCVMSYAGIPDAARIMFGKINDTFVKALKSSNAKSPREKIHRALGKIFKDRTAKGLQTLIGVQSPKYDCYLFKTSNNKVVPGVMDCIGGGDSSVLRYVCDFLLAGVPSVHDAEMLGSYIISVANRYVEGCSGGPDIATLHKDGAFEQNVGGLLPNQRERFQYCEAEIGRALRELLLSGGTKRLNVIP